MTDPFDRKITYLRVSLTENCNLRCRYCMPDLCSQKTDDELLTDDEIITAVKAAAELGINKIRLTGGEPLCRKSIISLCERINEIDGINEVAITTNGTMLSKFALPLKNAGVDRVNISIDTFNEDKYNFITRHGNLNDVIEGINSAIDAKFKKVKLNAVLIGGFNDDEIKDMVYITTKKPVDMRFIELMPMCNSEDFGPEAYIPCTTVLEKVPELEKTENDDGVARLYTLPDAMGEVGLITPISNHFCSKCSRIRLTADGIIKPCLHSSDEYSIKGKTLDEMRQAFIQAINAKPGWHGNLNYFSRSNSKRSMNQIGG